VWEDLIHNQRCEELRVKLAAKHSSDIAEALIQIHGKEQAVVFRLLPRANAAQVFAFLPADRQKALLRALSTDEVKSILDRMPPDDRTRSKRALRRVIRCSANLGAMPSQLRQPVIYRAGRMGFGLFGDI